MPLDPQLTYKELLQLQNEVAAEIRNIEQQREANRRALQSAQAVDDEIAEVLTHAPRLAAIAAAPRGQSPAAVEGAVRQLAEALFAVGTLTVRSARLAAGRTDDVATGGA